jgi:DNA-binding CsgD family transcriptional regulator
VYATAGRYNLGDELGTRASRDLDQCTELFEAASEPIVKKTVTHVLIYGLCGGILIAVLKYIEFRFLIAQHAFEIYGGLIAVIFAGLGIWLGLKWTKKKEVLVVKEVPVPSAQPFSLNEDRLKNLGITRRELEILELIAQGMSNREIAETLFVSENTVKTHSSRLFDKLSAKRRTQAVQIGKEMGLIP